MEMATAVFCCPEPRRTQEFAHPDTLSPFSSLAMKQPRTNRLATWMLDEDAPFSEQPPAKRIQGVLYSVYKFEVLTEQTKPVNDILAVITRLALRNGYAAISQITSSSYVQSHGGRASHSGRRNSGGAGQSAPGSTVPQGVGNGGSGPSKRPVKRGGSGDGEGNPNKKKKSSNEPQAPGQFYCIIFELNQQSPEAKEDHPCKDKRFITLESAVDHHLRIHVGHIQCTKCLIRKGTQTDMGKHKRAGCTTPGEIRKEILTHGENIRKAKSWDELKQLVAPNGEIEYDMADNTDKLARSSVGGDNNHVEQPAAPPQHPMSPIYPRSPEDDLFDRTFRDLLHNNHNDPFRYPLIPPVGISYDTSTLTQPPLTVNPQQLVKSNTDSGYSDLQGSSSQRDTRVYHHHHHRYSEVRNEASTGGGAGRAISGNEAPKQDPSSKLLERVNWVIEAFLECDNNPMGREMAHLCARNIAIQVPESILEVFADAYQSRVGPKGGTQAYDPPRAAKGKEEERRHGTADGV